MANITMDLQDFNSLMAMGTVRRRSVFLDLYNTGRVKAGASTASDVGSVVVAPSNPSATVDPVNTVITRIKAAIQASA